MTKKQKLNAKIHFKLIAIIIFTSLSFGSTTSNISPFIISQYAIICQQHGHPFDPHDGFIIGFISVSVLFGAFLGSLITGRLILRFGYKKFAVMSAFCVFISNLLPIIPYSWWYLSIARLIIGVFNSFLTAVIPPWISQLVPNHLASSLNGAAQIFINLGILLSALLMLIVNQHPNLYFVSFFGSLFGSLITAIICCTVQETKEISSMIIPMTQYQKKNTKLFEKRFLKAIVLMICIKCVIECSGINAIIIYGTLIFKSTFSSQNENLSQIYGSLLIAGINLVSGIMPIPFNQKMKRREILFLAVIICGAGVVIYFFIYLFSDIFKVEINQTILVVATVFYLIGFNIGLGPSFYILASELFPPECQPICTGIASVVHWTSNIVIILVFPLLQKKLWIFFLPILVIMIISTAILQIWLPETLYKSKERIKEEMFGASKKNKLQKLKEKYGRTQQQQRKEESDLKCDSDISILTDSK